MAESPTAPEKVERMNFKYSWRMARAMVVTSPGSARSFVAVGVVVLTLIISFAFINAMGDTMTQSARDVISGDVSGFAKGYEFSMLNQQADVVYYIDDADAVVKTLMTRPDIKTVRTHLNAGALISTTTEEAGAVVVGADFDQGEYSLLSGTRPSGTGEICINENQSEDMDLSVGDVAVLTVSGAQAKYATVQATVTCVYDSSRFGLFRTKLALMDIDGMRVILNRPAAATQLLITLADDADASESVKSLNASMSSMRFEVAETTAELLFTIRRAQQAVMWILVVVFALVCAVLVGNIERFSLNRERGEIGAMRAMGFSARELRRIYTMRSLILTTVMAAAGLLVALIATIICGKIGIPIGQGRQLFGDGTLHPRVNAVNLAVSATIVVVSVVASTQLTLRSLLQRTPVELMHLD